MTTPTTDQRLHRLTYISKPSKPLNMGKFLEILRKSRDNNMRDDVTGILAYGDGYFMQILEGSQRQLSTTYHRIVADSRHKNVTLIGFSPTSERCFSDWSMKHLCVRKDLLEKTRMTGKFDPQNWSEEKCLQFAFTYSSLLTMWHEHRNELANIEDHNADNPLADELNVILEQ